MTKTNVADVLRALATGDSNRSETARLRDIVDEVEAAIAAGVSRAAVLNALNDQGFTMTLKSFESALYRIRKKRIQVTNESDKAPSWGPDKPDRRISGLCNPERSEPAPAPQKSNEVPATQELGEVLDAKKQEQKTSQYIKSSSNPLANRNKKQE